MALTGTVLRTIVDNLGRKLSIRAILVRAVSNAIEEVGLAAEAGGLLATAEVVGLVQHVGDADLLQSQIVSNDSRWQHSTTQPGAGPPNSSIHVGNKSNNMKGTQKG